MNPRFSTPKPSKVVPWSISILLFTSVARPLERVAVDLLGESAVRNLLWGVFALMFLFAVRLLFSVYGTFTRRQWTAFFVFACMGVFIASSLQVTAERVHVASFGILGALVALGARRPWPRTLLRAALVGLLVAMLDEGFQYFLPNRVADLRDIWIGTLSAVWGAAGVVGTILPKRRSASPLLAQRPVAAFPRRRSFRRG